MSTPRITTTLALAALATALALPFATGCDKKSGGDSPAASGSATPAAGGAGANAAASKHKLKTKLTSAQLDDAWKVLHGNNDFKNHTKLMTDKLGPPAKTEGDESTWYGYDATADDCKKLSTSATKGSGTMGTSGAGTCWE